MEMFSSKKKKIQIISLNVEERIHVGGQNAVDAVAVGARAKVQEELVRHLGIKIYIRPSGVNMEGCSDVWKTKRNRQGTYLNIPSDQPTNPSSNRQTGYLVCFHKNRITDQL